ncbi:MAG: BspA family leucine-rich repeat surface protein, partial [Prevotella sp.]|nr:BspA family leucine-rich repeat surface protein [Prevotella sp.]
FHVFNIGDGGGFVIASADDVAVPVLGYCDKGAFDPDDIPVNMQAWLDGYSEEIGKARENGVVAKGDAPVYASRKKINPMIKSTWDQCAPYNDMCIFDGTRCLTGCVATGMAQIMYYWATTGIDGKRFRCGSTALLAYITSTQRYSVGALDALASFDWDSMTDGMPTTTKGKRAVAQLMRYCGQAVQMDYEEDGSGASLEGAARALQNNFDYNWSMKVIHSDDMTEQEWQDLVYDELAGGKPFLMSGLGTGGHAFICDGFDPANGKFHFSWGWSGEFDGWFAMTSLKPGGNNFSSTRYGIKNIQPFSGSIYVVLSTDGKTLSFYCDDKRKERTGTQYHLSDYSPSWYGDTDVEHVVFDSSFSEVRPVSTYNWFRGMKQLKDVTGLSFLNTSKVIYMDGMFYDCESLENIDVSHFDTSKVIEMNKMFENCQNLKTLDVSHFNTSNVTDMWAMFYGCKSLTSLDVSHFDTSKVKRMSYMFRDCNSVKSLDVSHFDTSNVTDMGDMFYECFSLENLDVSHFNTSKVTDMGYMFKSCHNLKKLDVSHFDTSNVTDMDGMFFQCMNLTSLDVSHFDTSKVTYMTGMFTDCNNLGSLDVSHFNTSKVTSMSYMFSGCNSLTSLDVSHFDMSNVRSAPLLFTDCSSLRDLYIPASLPELEEWGCLNVGLKSSPCFLHAPKGFDFGFTPPANSAFYWKGGWFILSEVYDVFAIGDVNHDGQVNITDVTLMVDHVLGGQPKVFYEENADMNNDGQTNITDVTLLVKATLGT